ncbi:HNH endonuclease signature motif containing protein [Mesorhizobium captivum]|uniref:HNH endonuclease signature motif containing protein n=1 Tax=Mesorhizobium captivum TaxID=3072319 RepID=UPI002A23F047|nr:HNH endonuclease signature motif containing protein [Mesorhizobium sp. VK23E]MDX8513551.1 HNH endonuclease signature motif containing protein [Mesorhizobium sp. VK23E]
MRWLEANRSMIISDYHKAFCEKFERDDVTAAHLHGLRKRMGWKVGRQLGRFAGRHTAYSPTEITWLRDNSTMEINAWCAAFRGQFDRHDVSPAKLHSLRKRMGWKTGRSGQFEAGHVSANKGKKCPPGVSGRHPNAQKTQFRKGQLPHNFRGAGHESTDEDGYVWIVVDQINPWTGASTWRVHKHRWLWEKKNGPVPEGHVLKCLDGDKANTDPSNWELVPIGLLPRLNGKSGRRYDTAAAELKPTIMAIAKLEHRVRGSRSRLA